MEADGVNQTPLRLRRPVRRIAPHSKILPTLLGMLSPLRVLFLTDRSACAVNPSCRHAQHGQWLSWIQDIRGEATPLATAILSDVQENWSSNVAVSAEVVTTHQVSQPVNGC